MKPNVILAQVVALFITEGEQSPGMKAEIRQIKRDYPEFYEALFGGEGHP